MRRELRRKAETKAVWKSVIAPLSVGFLLLVGVAAFYFSGSRPPETDDLQCPKDTGPNGATVLLLDTSDPLTPKHQAELDSLINEIVNGSDNELGLGSGELFSIYELTQDPAAPTTLFQRCRPYKNPKDRSLGDDIHQGRVFAERYWKRFEEAVDSAFLARESAPQPRSPLLETIAILAANYAVGHRSSKKLKFHLIVFSDLLQHTDRFSHYGPYPDAKDMRHSYRDLLTDLTGAKVSLYRLERQKYLKWQTNNHYYWWTELVSEQGGQVRFQKSI